MITLSDNIRQARSEAIANAIGVGATLTIYGGTRPAAGAAVTGQKTIVEFDLTGATSSLGILTFDPVAKAMAIAPGTATWARIKDADGFVMDMSVTVAGNGGDIELSTVNILAGALIDVTTAKIIEP